MDGAYVRDRDSATSAGVFCLENALSVAGTVALGITLQLTGETSLAQVRYDVAGKTFPAALSEQDAVCGDYLEYVSQKRSWFAAAERALRDMREIKHNWNGYGSEAPNACALQNAEDVLDVLADEDFDLAPTNVVPSADNGVGISFRNGERYALIECYNTGEIAAVVSNGPGHADSWDVAPAELRQTIERFHDHLRGTHSA